MAATLRQSERVTPLELFFDLVFVLALTQCTALMAAEPTWTGIGKGMLVLGALWWSWVGYSWLTNVLDPQEGGVRLAMFSAMAALLVAALCVPNAFGDDALLFACAYGVFRAAQLALYLLASRDNPALRRSVLGLTGGSAIGVGLLITASAYDGWKQGALWAAALLLDMAEPYFFGSAGWSLDYPSHFAERHGLIVIIALGESIVAIGVGAGAEIDAGVVVAAILGIAVGSAIWWLYFDVIALLAERHLARLPPGKERNERARDTYSYLHFPMIAGIILSALGLKKTLEDVEASLDVVIAFAMFGGVGIYLLAHVAARLRHVRTVNWHRLLCALVLFALIPIAMDVIAVAALAMLTVALWVLIALEAVRFTGSRQRAQQALAEDAATH
jgi:low temperature requirement protein LtrA